MKKLLLSLAFISSFAGFSQVLSENFEGATFPPTGWTRNETEPARFWRPTTDLTQAGQDTFLITGANSAFIGWIVGDQDANLISPSFSLATFNSAQMTVNVKVGYEWMVSPNPNGDLTVGVSTDGGANWTALWVEEDYGTFTDYQTLALTLNMTPYVGQSNVQIKFNYVGNDADSVSVDDVIVTGSLSTNEFLVSKFSVTPNPVENELTITNTSDLNVKNVTISDINGRVVKTIDASSLNSKVNVSDLNAGVYFVNINTDTTKVVKKIVKN